MTDSVLPPVQSPDVTYGFVNVIELAGLGFCGGLLLVSPIGRPIEFHCTTPVSINRAQQIVYGHTYRDYLLGDQIGGALIERLQRQPTLLLSRNPELLNTTRPVPAPVVWVAPPDDSGAAETGRWLALDIPGAPSWTLADHGPLQAGLECHLQHFTSRLPLEEPFERISQAIEEAHAVLRVA